MHPIISRVFRFESRRGVRSEIPVHLFIWRIRSLELFWRGDMDDILGFPDIWTSRRCGENWRGDISEIAPSNILIERRDGRGIKFVML